MIAVDAPKYPTIKTPEEISYIKDATIIARNSILSVKDIIKPGERASIINHEIEKYILKNDAFPANKEVDSYLYASCISVWDEVAHCTPSVSKLIQREDIVSIDLGIKKNGYYGDYALTFLVGKINDIYRDMIHCCYDALMFGINKLKPGVLLSDYGTSVDKYIKKYNFNVIKELTGHGIGKEYHEPPKVYNFYSSDNNIELKSGMVFALELLIEQDNLGVAYNKSKFGLITKSGEPAVHFEKTIAITDNGVDILA